MKQVLIKDLEPGQNYVLQIRSRAKSGATSAWSTAFPLLTDSDEEAPSTPSAPSVSLGTSMAQVSHDLTKNGGGQLEPDTKYLEVHASSIDGFDPDETTQRGEILVADPTIDVSGVFYYLPSDSTTNLYWRVIAVDSGGNKSDASPQASGLPGLIEGVNMANATITNGKIYDLEAQKITAGSGIVNDILVKSKLTVADGGDVESENYSAGSTGWQIKSDGSSEFNSVSIRGAWKVQSGASSIEAKNFTIGLDTIPIITFTNKSTYSINVVSRTGLPTAGEHMGITSDSGSVFFIRNIGLAFTTPSQKSLLLDSDGFLKNGVYTGPTSSADGWSTTGWIAPTLQNGWTQLTSNFSPFAYRLMPDGSVAFRGGLVPGTKTNGTILFTLPTGYRPPYMVQLTLSTDVANFFNIAQIDLSGNVRIYHAGSAGAYVFDGLRVPVI